MILSVSRRTDIPALYGAWFLDKLRRGECAVKNPFNGVVERVFLDPENSDAFVFWSRNYRPFLRALDEVAARGYPFYCQNSILGYPRIFDPGSPAIGRSVTTAHAITHRYGPRRVVWRYDPIILTSLTDAAWHQKNFATLLDLLDGAVDECVISFIDHYKKLERTFYPLLRREGVELFAPTHDELFTLAAALSAMAAARGVTVRACCEPDFSDAIPPASCVDPERLRAVGLPGNVSFKKSPTRAGCGCFYAKDIGAYDSCTLGCACCYANRSRRYAQRRRREHDPEGLALM